MIPAYFCIEFGESEDEFYDCSENPDDLRYFGALIHFGLIVLFLPPVSIDFFICSNLAYVFKLALSYRFTGT